MQSTRVDDRALEIIDLLQREHVIKVTRYFDSNGYFTGIAAVTIDGNLIDPLGPTYAMVFDALFHPMITTRVDGEGDDWKRYEIGLVSRPADLGFDLHGGIPAAPRARGSLI